LSEKASASNLDFPVGGGDTGALIRSIDWSKTSIGPLSQWPAGLRSVTNMLLLSPVPIVLLWGEDGVMIYNDAYSVFAGSRHPKLLGSKVREGWSEIADFNDNVMRVGLAGKTLAYRDQELTLTRHGKPAPVWMNLDYSPVLDESGKPAGVIAFVVETTELVLAQRKIALSEERFRAFTNATSDVIYRMSSNWREMRALDGRGVLADTNEPSVAWQEEYLLPEDMESIQAEINAAVEKRGVFEHEHRVRRSDGSIGWTLSRAVPIIGEDGEIVEWFGAASDITEKKRDQERMALVVHELNHRVKNNLAMVQAIATQTFRGQIDISAAMTDFEKRLIALARANDLLTGERWSGASLMGVIAQAITPHKPSDDRLLIEGADVALTPKTALAMTLAFHELATNALKYGAWSDEKGKVTVSCRITEERDRGRFRLQWRETGGPEVSGPKRRGFGSKLIERGLAHEVQGQASIAFEPAGVVCVVDAPLQPDA
jgi:two-component sensor histidine kinase/PAS domain-containing protein